MSEATDNEAVPQHLSVRPPSAPVFNYEYLADFPETARKFMDLKLKVANRHFIAKCLLNDNHDNYVAAHEERFWYLVENFGNLLHDHPAWSSESRRAELRRYGAELADSVQLNRLLETEHWSAMLQAVQEPTALAAGTGVPATERAAVAPDGAPTSGNKEAQAAAASLQIPPVVPGDDPPGEKALDVSLEGRKAERKELRDGYKAECKQAGIRVTDEMIAEAASSRWHSRFQVQKWLACDSDYDGEPDRMIRRVFQQKPHLK